MIQSDDSFEPWGHTIFCDDVRYEVDGKRSYIGVYTGSIIIFDQFPVTLPKFCFVLYLTQHKKNFVADATIKLLLPGEAVVTMDFKERSPGSTVAPAFEDDTISAVTIESAITAAMFRLEKPGEILVRADLAGKTIKMGRLQVVAGDPNRSSTAQ